MPSNDRGDGRAPGSRFSLGGVMIVIALLALLLAIVSRAAQTGSPHDWGIVVLNLGILAILAVPILILGLLIRYSPSSRGEERDLIGLVVMTLLFVVLICLSVFTNRT
jgi:Kef-type K+ transport system membrane component KefB